MQNEFEVTQRLVMAEEIKERDDPSGILKEDS